MLRNDVDVVEVGDRRHEEPFGFPHRHLLGDFSDGRGDLSDDRFVQVRVGRGTRQQQDGPSPYRGRKVSPPDLVLPYRSPGAPRPSQTAGSNAASGLSGWRAYASAMARSSASQSAFKIAARTNSDRRRERAGATRSKRPASSSSISIRSDFIPWSIKLAPGASTDSQGFNRMESWDGRGIGHRIRGSTHRVRDSMHSALGFRHCTRESNHRRREASHRIRDSNH